MANRMEDEVVWVVWESNRQAPKVFSTQEKAESYRNERANRVRHPVWIAEVGVDD